MSNENELPSKAELQSMDSDALISFAVELSEIAGLDLSSENGEKLSSLCQKYGPAHEAGESFELEQEERGFLVSLGLAEEEELTEIS